MPQNIAINLLLKCEPYINPKGARTLAGEFVASQTLARGTILGQVTASSKLKAYASGNGDGSQVAVGILVYDIVVDASGNIIMGPSGSVVDINHSFEKTAEYYYTGDFLITDLVGYDATALSTLKAVVKGMGTSQWIHLP